MNSHRLPCWLPAAILAAGVAVLQESAPGGEPAVKGYADYETYRAEVRQITRSKLVKLSSLARTAGGREVFCLEIGTGKLHEKPAILVVGGVHPPHLVGSELAVRMTRKLVDQAAADKQVAAILDRLTFYVIPRPSPDPCEAFFRTPYVERAENERPLDEDGDGAVDEDGPDDLDGDGWITTIRVEDPAGAYMAHPDDPRALVRADPVKNQRGRWSLYVEGRDNDRDDRQNEDPPGGTAFNRNFTFRYPYFQRGAGPHQVSEPETRAVADFAFSHPNIALVLTFTLEDNLMRPWKPNPQAESERVKTTVLAADAGYLNYLAEQYRAIHGGSDCPDSPQGQGSFSEWSYFHFGRWSLACRGWWIPQVKPEGPKTNAKEPADKPPPKRGQDRGDGEDAGNGQSPADAKAKSAAQRGRAAAKAPAGERPRARAADAKPAEPRPPEDGRGADELSALRWLDREKIDGFVPWKRIEHPDFPGRLVEVGGIKPFVRLNPPARELDPLADTHWRFLRWLVELLPQLAIHQSKAEPLGGGVWRLSVTAVNRGYLPSVSQMGRITGEPLPLQAAIELPPGVRLVTGHPRLQLPPLPGNGGKAEVTWLASAPAGKEHRLTVRVWSPSVGDCRQTIVLPAK